MQNRKMSAEEKRWQAESDLRTLQAAEQIRSDAARRRAAETQAKAQMAALKRVAGKPAASKRAK